MKARSVVFTHIQHPGTTFGLPPMLFLLSVGAAMVVLVALFLVGIFVLPGAMAFSFIGFAIVLVAGLAQAYRLGRTDRHVESVYFTAARFWGSSPRRWLLAGSAPVTPRGGRS